MPSPRSPFANEDAAVLHAIRLIERELRTPDQPDRRLYDLLTEGQRAIYSLEMVQREIQNGGFDQMLFNRAGFLLPEAAEGARYIHATEHRSLFNDAITLLANGEFPRSHLLRRDALLSLTAARQRKLEQLDEAFFELENSKANLTRIMAAFLSERPADFYR